MACVASGRLQVHGTRRELAATATRATGVLGEQVTVAEQSARGFAFCPGAMRESLCLAQTARF